jgi:hypothetical protein
MAKRNQVVEAKETPQPWQILEGNQRLRDGRDVVDIAGNTGKGLEYWEIVATKMLVPDARRMIAAMRYCGNIPTDVLERGSVALAHNSLVRSMIDLINFAETHKAALIGVECTSEEYEAAVKPAVLARDEARNSLHSATIPTVVTYQINKPEARGEVQIKQSRYGLDIYINGKCLAEVDLFFFSPEWTGQSAEGKEPDKTEDRPKEKSGMPQITLYTGADTDDQAGYVRWVDGQVVMLSDHPEARTETINGPAAPIRVIKVREEDTSARGATD